MASRPIAAFFAIDIARSAQRFLIVAVFALALGACENLSELSDVQKVADFAVYGNPDVEIDRAAVEQQPWAMIRARMGLSGRVVMVLGRYDGADLHWISADYVALATRHGRIVKTAGLAESLVNTIHSDPDPVVNPAHDWKAPVKTRRVIDIEPGDHYGLTVVGTVERIAVEEIEILEFRYMTNLLRERAYVAELDWDFENYFWVDAKTGFVWKSIQHVTPSMPPVEIEILKPAG
jgi:hypothetical protein